jgi:hypothetical protein
MNYSFEERIQMQESFKECMNFPQFRGVAFENEVEKQLKDFFNTPEFSVHSNLCFRDIPIDEGFDERFEIDFIVKRCLDRDSREIAHLYNIKLIDDELVNRMNPIFLIEAKSSIKEWIFFCSEKALQNYFYLTINDKHENTTFFSRYRSRSDRSLLQLPLSKRSVVCDIDGNGKLKPSNKCEERGDTARNACRQIIKNTQRFLKKHKDKLAHNTLFKIVVTDTQLSVVEDNEIKPVKSLIMEIDEKLSFKGEDIALQQSEAKDIYKGQSKIGLTLLDDYVTSFSKIHVLICNISELKPLINTLLPDECARLPGCDKSTE